MAVVIDNLSESIRSTKQALRKALPNHAEVFRQVEAEMRRRVNTIVKERETGEPVIPIVHYSDVRAGAVPPELIAKIQDRGACVVRRTFDPNRPKPGTTRSPNTSTRTGSTRNWPMLPKTNTLERSHQPSRRSTASTGRVRRFRHGRPSS